MPVPPEPGIVRVPAWNSYPWLRAAFSTRQGGVSSAYGAGELNLGWTASDPAKNVAENRSRFVRAAANGALFELATISQIHSADIRAIEKDHSLLATSEGKAVLRGDGLVTAEPGIMLGIQTADCVPVLLADTRLRVVVAIHAGWRGTLARIVEHGIASMQQRYASEASDLVAAIGPCIGPCCFAIGPEVGSQFEGEFSYAPTLFRLAGGQMYMDLVEANRRQLLRAGVAADRITDLSECTTCMRLDSGRRKYFSHRAEAGFTGRMMSVIGIVPG